MFIAEVVSAIVTGSLALLVDAGHMLTDMSVLIASTVTAVLMQRKPSNKRTWGWRDSKCSPPRSARSCS